MILVHDREKNGTDRKKIRRREAMASGAALVRFKAVSPSPTDSHNRHRAAAWTRGSIQKIKKKNKSLPLANHRAPFSEKKFLFPSSSLLLRCSFFAPSLLLLCFIFCIVQAYSVRIRKDLHLPTTQENITAGGRLAN